MIRFIFVLCCLLISSASIFGQTLEADLNKAFTKHSVVKINNKEALKKAKNQIPFKFTASGKTFQFILTPNEIRSEKYQAEYTDKSGVHSMPRGELITYTGTLIGEKDSALAFTVEGNITEGFFIIGKEEYFFESAKKYSSHASDDDKVIYQRKDKVKKDSFECELDKAIKKELDRTSTPVMSANTSSPQWNGIKIIELATEADYEWVSLFGGNTQSANNHIISILNRVDVIYRRDLKLTIKVTYQHFFTVPDNYRSGSLSNTLADFRSDWNRNHPNEPRDLAHLFTGKYSSGIAYLGVVCLPSVDGLGNDDYGLSGYFANDAAQAALTAHEIGHNLGADHVENSGSCADTIMNMTVSNLSTSFCEFSKTQITNFVNANGYCLDLEPTEPPIKTLFDFDADGKADISVFRPSDGFWYIQQSGAGGFYGVQFGLATDKLAPADYDGDGKTDIGVFRNGNWYIQRSSQGFIGIGFGAAGDIPVPGDFDGDQKAELAVYRPSDGKWFTFNLVSNQPLGETQLGGVSGDKPVIGDFDGDGKNDYAVFRTQNGTWYIQPNGTQSFYGVAFGYGTDIPAPADFDGDRKTDIAVFRPSDGVWSVQRSRDGFYGIQYGQSGDIPGPADYDGDRKADISVFRPIADPSQPSYGAFYRINSTSQSSFGIAFGQNGDIPVPSFNIVQ